MVFEWVDGWLVTCVWLSHLNADNWLPDCDPRPDEKGQLLDKVSLRPSSSSSSFEFANESFFELNLSDHCCPNWCLEPFWTKTWVKGAGELKSNSSKFFLWPMTPFPPNGVDTIPFFLHSPNSSDQSLWNGPCQGNCRYTNSQSIFWWEPKRFLPIFLQVLKSLTLRWMNTLDFIHKTRLEQKTEPMGLKIVWRVGSGLVMIYTAVSLIQRSKRSL